MAVAAGMEDEMGTLVRTRLGNVVQAAPLPSIRWLDKGIPAQREPNTCTPSMDCH